MLSEPLMEELWRLLKLFPLCIRIQENVFSFFSVSSASHDAVIVNLATGLSSAWGGVNPHNLQRKKGRQPTAADLSIFFFLLRQLVKKTRVNLQKRNLRPQQF